MSGPLINLILAILSGLKLQEHFSLNLYVFLCINLVLFIFNILPVNFLDGGQIIQLFCQSASIQKTAEKASFAFIIIAVMLFTGNIIFSALAVMMFFVYCYINKKDLQ
ncbi:MAG: site-2 protease family protein [Oscillospiraceae bacterium]|nr:site-2 protease family protein [Oscillospiraceae bacterium]